MYYSDAGITVLKHLWPEAKSWTDQAEKCPSLNIPRLALLPMPSKLTLTLRLSSSWDQELIYCLKTHAHKTHYFINCGDTYQKGNLYSGLKSTAKQSKPWPLKLWAFQTSSYSLTLTHWLYLQIYKLIKCTMTTKVNRGKTNKYILYGIFRGSKGRSLREGGYLSAPHTFLLSEQRQVCTHGTNV